MKGKVFIYLGVLGLGVLFWISFRRAPLQHALESRELATRQLGDYLARTFPGQRVLVFSNPFAQEKNIRRDMFKVEEAGVRGLKSGFADKLKIEAVVYPELKAQARENPRSVFIDPETTTPLSYLVAEDALDTLWKAHGECGIIVSLIGLPADLAVVDVWQKADGPKFALLLPDLRMVGDAEAIRRVVESGKLAAFILEKPGSPPEQTPLKGDEQAEFERRYLLVTPENIDAILEQYPQLFQFRISTPSPAR